MNWARAFRSRPDMAQRLHPGDWFVAGAIAWLGPLALAIVVMVLGYGVVAVENATGTLVIAASGLLFAIAYGLFMSPILGLPALAAAALAVWGLIRMGWGGGLSAALAGALAGAAGFAAVFGVLEITGPALGALYAVLYRAGLIRLQREIFTPR